MAEDPLKKIPDEPPIPIEGNGGEDVDLGEDLDFLKWREKLNEVESKEHDLLVERALLRQRQIYAFLLFGLMASWLIFISLVIFLSGAGAYPNVRLHDELFKVHFPREPFKLSDPVLIALISTTTVNVLGLFYIVARWLFPTKQSDRAPLAAGNSAAINGSPK